MLLGSSFGGCASLNIDCNETLEESPRLIERLCFKDTKPRRLGGGDDGTGDVGRLGMLSEPMIPFLADWGVVWLGAPFFFGVKERKKDHSDSN